MVNLGRLRHDHGPASYAFPTATAARYFALNHKRRDPHRDITVESPDGDTTAVPLTPGEFWERDFEGEMNLSLEGKQAAQAAASRRVADEVEQWWPHA